MKKVEKNECQEKVLKDEERREFLDNGNDDSNS